jgi:HEAT repeat protein
MQQSDPDAEIARLIAIVTAARVPWREREQAAERLTGLGEPAVLPLIQGVTQGSLGPGRALVFRALGQLRDARAVEPLIAALADESPHVRQDAAKALGLIGDPRAIGPLIGAFRVEYGDTEDITAWQDAAIALARLGTPALDPLVGALSDENGIVRAESAYALGELGDRRAVEPLVAALEDGGRQVRLEAAEALGRLGDPRAIDALVALLDDPDAMVRLYAVRALGHLVRDKVFAPIVAAVSDQHVDVRRQALFALAESAGVASVHLLLANVSDPDPCVRDAAVHALSGVGDSSLIPLLESIEQKDQGRCRAGSVKGSARYAIACIQKRHAVQPT